MTDDLVKRLRYDAKKLADDICGEAADRIEKLEEVLKSYACDCVCILTDEDACEMGSWDNALCGKRACQTLGNKNEQ